MKRSIAALLLVSLSLTGCDSGNTNTSEQNRGANASLEGYIYLVYDGSRIGNVDVSLLGTNHSVKADSAGRYKFTGVEPGNYVVLISRDSFAYDRHQTVSLHAGDSLVRQFGITPMMGMWTYTVKWDGFQSYTGQFRLQDKADVRLGPDNAYWPGKWSLIKDTFYMIFENSRYKGIINDSMTGSVINFGSPDSGVFSARR
jgi:hypothetical protein